MARSAGNVIENNFTRGLITEATGLNFPENAVTETWNCVFEPKGLVRRRLGIDLEDGASTVAQLIPGAIVEYLWEAVSNTGTRTFLVLQLGVDVSFYQLSADGALSAGVKDFFVRLTEYQTKAGVRAFRERPCSFASGNGRLFICHPYMNPVQVEYDDATDTIEVTEVVIKTRDFEGVDDGLEAAEEPETLTALHHYNLKNQGWYPETVTVVTAVLTREI